MKGEIYHIINEIVKVRVMDFRCDKASEIGITRLATVKCPTGLAFDIDRQTCDWKTNVKNCDQLESKKNYHYFVN